MVTAGAFYRALLGRIDPVVVPLANRRLARRVLAEPDRLKQRVDEAIERGVAYFEARPQVELAALFLLGRLYRTGTCPELAFIEDRITSFAATTDDPHLRLLDADYVPSGDPDSPDPRYDHPVLRLMIRCLYADRTGDERDCLNALAQIGDGGGYGTTHIVVGAMILREFTDLPVAEIADLCAPLVPTVVAAQERDRCGDLFAERIAVLQWLDRHDAVRLPFILRLIRGQKSDGGWAAGPSLRAAKSSQHTSALALVALAQWSSVRCKVTPSGMRPFWKKRNACGEA